MELVQSGIDLDLDLDLVLVKLSPQGKFTPKPKVEYREGKVGPCPSG